jgi:ATP phosphoribosyltransferase
VTSVRDGSVDFGLTGLDVTAEYGRNGEILVLHESLGFGHCKQAVAVPESWDSVTTLADLATYTRNLGQPLRWRPSLPTWPKTSDPERRRAACPRQIRRRPGNRAGHRYADCIVDLVASGQTLADNRLRPLADGVVMRSEAALIANRNALRDRPDVLAVARTLLEFTEAHLRAQEHTLIVRNMRGDSPQTIARQIFAQHVLGGLQGPTIALVVVREDLAAEGGPHWHAVPGRRPARPSHRSHRRTPRHRGSGVVVTP